MYNCKDVYSSLRRNFYPFCKSITKHTDNNDSSHESSGDEIPPLRVPFEITSLSRWKTPRRSRCPPAVFHLGTANPLFATTESVSICVFSIVTGFVFFLCVSLFFRSPFSVSFRPFTTLSYFTLWYIIFHCVILFSLCVILFLFVLFWFFFVLSCFFLCYSKLVHGSRRLTHQTHLIWQLKRHLLLLIQQIKVHSLTNSF